MRNRTENRFVFIDTETGGTIPEKHSLLSIGCVVWDKNYGILDKIELFIYHNRYNITQQARKINKFDRDKHNLIAKEPNIVINELLDFLHKYFDENIAIPLIGHNVQFDINFMKVFFRKNNRSFEQYFSYRSIDTYSVFKSLVLAGKIDANIDSSAEAFKYFEIKIDNRHSALADCLATIKLYENILGLLK